MNKLENIKIGFALSGSFCTFERVFKEMEKLINEGAEIFPIMSNNASTISSRFGKSSDFINKIEEITGKSVQTKIEETELIGPNKLYNALIVAPCTGNTFAKMANGITDTSVLMAIKASLRNNTPVILAIATNDALGLNLKNIGTLMNTRNVYFVPFKQDDYKAKRNSLVSNMDLIIDTLIAALKGEQIQPIFAY